MPNLPRANGYVILLLVVMMLLFGIGGVLYKNSQSGSLLSGQRSTQTSARFDRLETAISDFVKANGRLPCPASPTDSSGKEPSGSTTTCAVPDGVTPWGALGLSLDDALDAWSRKISYRAYTGSKGFTQTSGLNVSDCTSNSLLTTSASPQNATTGLCETNPHGTLKADFYTGKGFTVSDFAASKTVIAYVLISHGATGYGSYGADHSATRYTLPNASSNEYHNIGANGPFYLQAESDSSVDTSAAAHFDDLLRYKSASDLLAQAKLDAHDWGWVTLAKSFSNTSLVVNANTTPTSTLTLTFTNTNTNVATLTSALVDNLPSLAVASAPNYTTTCAGTSYAPTAGLTTLTIPAGFTIPAATGNGASKISGTCTMSVAVYGIGTTPATLTNTIAAGSSAGGTGGLQTDRGWNLSAVTSNSITTTFNAPTVGAISPTAVTGSNSAQSITLTGTGFVSGATVTFTNVTSGVTYSPVTASSVSLTSLSASQNFGTSNSSWTAKATNPDGQASGTLSFYVYNDVYQQTTFTAAALSAALGYTVTAGSSTGASTVNYTNFAVTSFATGYPNIAAFYNATSGFQGLGVATSGGTISQLTTNFSGGIRYTLPLPYRYFGLTLYQFGTASSGTVVERASVAYYDAGGTLITTQTLKACRNGTTSQAASYSLDPGASFSKVEITSLPRLGSGTSSNFFIGETAFCLLSSSCITQYSAANSATSDCTYP